MSDQAVDATRFISRRALADDVYDAVTALLVDGEIRPGGRANIEVIARQLAVSPTPVREALVRLESEGLVRKEPLKGYTAVPLLNPGQFDELFYVRGLLEPAAAFLAATNMSDEGLSQLAFHVQQMTTAIVAGPVTNRHYADYKSYILTDASFHGIIAESSGNQVLADSIVRLRPHTHNYRLNLERSIADQTIEEHRRILEAMNAHDPQKAHDSMTEHLMCARERTAAFFASHADDLG